MGYRSLEIEVISAQDLEDVKLFTNREVYAVGLIFGKPQTMQKTTVARDGGTNPTWGFVMVFTIDELEALHNFRTLLFQICCGDRVIGGVYVPVKELLDPVVGGGNASSPRQFVSYRLTDPSMNPKGVLNFSYEFGEKFTIDATGAAVAVPQVVEGTTTTRSLPYPRPPPATWPSPPLGGYPYSVAGYGHPPPYYHYPSWQPVGAYNGYPPRPVQQPGKLFGLGLGAEWLGRVLTGAWISDMMSDATDYM